MSSSATSWTERRQAESLSYSKRLGIESHLIILFFGGFDLSTTPRENSESIRISH